MIRHWSEITKAKLYGSDYNAALINWCTKNLTFAEFNLNTLKPGLPYADNSISFSYAISVFTHLSEESQKSWLSEIFRILSPGGIFLFTAHGNQFKHLLADFEITKYEHGECILKERASEGKNSYGSFFNKIYVETKLLTPSINLLKYVPGRDHEDLKQDMFFLQKN